jgi:hypothetical protein
MDELDEMLPLPVAGERHLSEVPDSFALLRLGLTEPAGYLAFTAGKERFGWMRDSSGRLGATGSRGDAAVLPLAVSASCPSPAQATGSIVTVTSILRWPRIWPSGSQRGDRSTSTVMEMWPRPSSCRRE